MRTKLLSALLMCATAFGFAQTQVVSINIGTSLDYDGNHLYIAELFDNEISRIDLAVGASSIETVTTISRPEGVAVNGNEIYTAGISSGGYHLTDISGGVPATKTTVISASSFRTIVHDPNFGLYIIKTDGGSNTKVYSVSNPSDSNTYTYVVDVPTGDVRSATIDGTEMYLASNSGGAIYKFDLNNVATPTIVKSGLNQPYEIDIVDNHLYYASEGGILAKFDLADTASSTTFVNNTLGDLAGIEVVGEDIYFTSWDNNAVYKMTDPDLVATTVNIPDANFKAILVADTAINTDGDTEISTTEARNYSGVLNVANSTIADLTGIEAFTNITELIANNNIIETVDLTQNRDLIAVNLDSNTLTSIDIVNGYNHNIAGADFTTLNNPDLTCIQVDDETYSKTNWTNVDATTNFAKICCLVNIPNANFKAILVANSYINTDGDTEISCDEATAYTGKIDVGGESITDLTGIEAFTNIWRLSCGDNQLTSLDVSENIALTELYCYSNQLINLDVSANTVLTSLQCFSNSIASLNVSANTALTRLDCYSNQLTSLDVSGATALTILLCNDNLLTNLNVSANTALYYLKVQDNALTSLNVANSNDNNFTYFNATNNPDLTCIQVDDTAYSTTNWTNIDATSTFSENCASLSIADNTFNNTISVYPNPIQNTLNISLATGQTLKSVQVFTLLGKKVLEANTSRVDFSAVSAGMYLLKVENTAGKVAVRKIVKQ